MGAAVLACALLCAGVRVSARRPHRDVGTAQGVVRGYLAPDEYYAFLGIPYAQAPSGARRFQEPSPPRTWDGIFEATHRIKCAQASEGREDCLVVNVFAPAQAVECSRLPVLLHVHHGGFHYGRGMYKPPLRLVQDFIFVTFNYRLGALGFLCLGTQTVPGNAGLRDQLLVLDWIKTNIVKFGGNPGDVTLYGTGSGAVAVQILLISGLVGGLTNRAILESGSVLAPASLIYEPYATALKVAESLGYRDSDNVTDLERFYVGLSLSELVNISTNFLPCVEGGEDLTHSMLDMDPAGKLKIGNFDHVPLLMASTNAEEILVLEEYADKFSDHPNNLKDLLPDNLEFESEVAIDYVSDIVKEYYFDHEHKDSAFRSYGSYMNDVIAEYPMVKFAKMYVSLSRSPVYLMKFSYQNSLPSGQEHMQSKRMPGASHGDILNYIYSKYDLDSEEEQVSGKLIRLWTNFIKIGDPTPLTTSLVPVVWPPVDMSHASINISKIPCLLFGKIVTVGPLPSSERLQIWEIIYSKYGKVMAFDTPPEVIHDEKKDVEELDSMKSEGEMFTDRATLSDKENLSDGESLSVKETFSDKKTLADQEILRDRESLRDAETYSEIDAAAEEGMDIQ